MNIMEEFKDKCKGLEVFSEEIAADLRELPTDYKLAEQYTEIDREIYELLKLYKNIRKEIIIMEDKIKYLEFKMKKLNNRVQDFKVQQFSHVQR